MAGGNPLKDTTTSTCIRALVTSWIARFGVPMDMLSDRGSQFTSELWVAMAKLLGSSLHHTTSYHPQANGLVERFHHYIKSALRAHLTGPNWVDELPCVLLGICTAPKQDLGCSYAEPAVPGNFITLSDHQQEHH